MLRKANVTIEDVAEKVGVSRQTVSRVINKGPNVKPAMRARVEDAIVELGYVPNLSARRMGGGRNYLILAINDRQRTLENWQAGRGNDWVDRMLYGGMTECEKHGYHMVFELIDTDADKAPRQLADAVTSLRPDGVILTPPHSDNPELAALLAEHNIACARIGRRDGSQQIDVFMDENGAARQVVMRLNELGHSRIAFVAGSPEYGSSKKRITGFHEALHSLGIPAKNAPVATGDFRFDVAATAIGELLDGDNRPTAIIADNDEMAFAALHEADRRGLRIPEDLSVISFEDTPGIRFSVPPLSAVRQPTAEMIAKASQALIEASKGGERAGRFELDYTIVERATTGPAPE